MNAYRRFPSRLALSASLIAALSLSAPAARADASSDPASGLVVSYPETPRAGCPGSRARLYSECGQQTAIYQKARDRADTEGKELLILAGAEWCVWCHVLDATLKGFVDGAAAARDPDVTAAADALREAVAQRFVIAHIEIDKSPDGEGLVKAMGSWPHFEDWIPFAFGVDDQGNYVAKLGERVAETGAYGDDAAADESDELTEEEIAADLEPPGYDRALLRDRIIALHAAITAGD